MLTVLHLCFLLSSPPVIVSPPPGSLLQPGPVTVAISVSDTATLRRLLVDTETVQFNELGQAQCQRLVRPPLAEIRVRALRKGSEEEGAVAAYWIGYASGAQVPRAATVGLGPNTRLLGDMVTEIAGKSDLAAFLKGTRVAGLNTVLLGSYDLRVTGFACDSPKVSLFFETGAIRLNFRLRRPDVTMAWCRSKERTPATGMLPARLTADDLLVEMRMLPAGGDPAISIDCLLMRAGLLGMKTDIAGFPDRLLEPLYPQIQSRIELGIAQALERVVERNLPEQITRLAGRPGTDSLALHINAITLANRALGVTFDGLFTGGAAIGPLALREPLPPLPPAADTVAFRILLAPRLLDQLLSEITAPYRTGFTGPLVNGDTPLTFAAVRLLYPGLMRSVAADAPLSFVFTAPTVPRLLASDSQPLFLWPGIALAVTAPTRDSGTVTLLTLGGDLAIPLSVSGGETLALRADSPIVRVELTSAATSALGQYIIRSRLESIAGEIGAAVVKALERDFALPRHLAVSGRMVGEALLIEAGN